MADETDAKCPICGSKAKLLDKTGDGTGFDCPTHSQFKVADPVFNRHIPPSNGRRRSKEQSREPGLADHR